jgi:hypothetical protein
MMAGRRANRTSQANRAKADRTAAPFRPQPDRFTQRQDLNEDRLRIDLWMIVRREVERHPRHFFEQFSRVGASAAAGISSQ